MIDPALKNRLVGVAVLLVLAALLLPALFDGANETTLLADARMPVPPEVPAAETLLADAPAVLPQAEAEIDAAHAPAEPETQVAPVAVAPGTLPAPVAPAAALPAPAKAPVVTPPAPVTQPVAAVPADPRLASLAEAWEVQLAAVSTAESAEQLRARLVLAGYKARVVPGKLFRVRAGPELRREDAIALRAKLAADARFSKLKGDLVRYVP